MNVQGRRSGGRGNRHKQKYDWSEPRPEEHHQRIIKNKPHIWNPQTKRWLQDTSVLLAQITGRANTAPTTIESRTNLPNNQQIQIAAANAERGLTMAMTGFRSAMQNLE